MKEVVYQIGVDVLGFPIYMEHYVSAAKWKRVYYRRRNVHGRMCTDWYIQKECDVQTQFIKQY